MPKTKFIKNALIPILARVPSRRWPGWTILMYHRVVPDAQLAQCPFREITASQSDFGMTLDWLSRHARVVSLDQGMEALRCVQARSAPPLVSITFDDGYLDNYTVAMPELARRGFPATFYIGSDYAAGKRRFWWDEAASHAKRTGEDFLALRQRLHAMPTDEQARAVAAFGGAGVNSGAERLYMNRDEVRDLIRLGMTVGNHTATHPPMDELTPAACEREILAAHATLTSWTGGPIAHFAYPDGRVNPAVEPVLQRLGYRSAVNTVPRRNHADAAPYALCRVDGHRLENAGAFSAARARFWLLSGATGLR